MKLLLFTCNGDLGMNKSGMRGGTRGAVWRIADIQLSESGERQLGHAEPFYSEVESGIGFQTPRDHSAFVRQKYHLPYKHEPELSIVEHVCRLSFSISRNSRSTVRISPFNP